LLVRPGFRPRGTGVPFLARASPAPPRGGIGGVFRDPPEVLQAPTRGSSASRTASPRKFRPSTVTNSAAPGPKTIHGACWRYPRPALIMLPHEASGGWTPRPRNDSEASARMANATLRDAWTTIGVAAFGRTWRAAIRQPGAPSARAASTNSRARMV